MVIVHRMLTNDRYNSDPLLAFEFSILALLLFLIPCNSTYHDISKLWTLIKTTT
jgi:hypothetical protein